MLRLESLFVGPEDSLRTVLTCIDRNTQGIALVIDGKRRLLGTITDGDIRRAILHGLNLSLPVSALLERKRTATTRGPITAAPDTPLAEIHRLMQQHRIRQVPVVDDENTVLDVVTINELLPCQPLPVQAVIMAGGFGKRLHPLTEDTPKPMLPVGDRPLLEVIVDQLRRAGVGKLVITTHHQSEKIVNHFGDGQRFVVEIDYLKKDRPLGTAGGLGLMDAPDGPLFVMNGDVLTQVDVRAMLEFHQEQQAALTIGVRTYDLKVPYGVVENEGGLVQRIVEKPVYHLFVNAGVYLLNPNAYHQIPRGQRFDMTDLIQRLLESGQRVASFPIIEYWLDIGRHDDYRQAQEDVQKGRFAA